MHFFSMSVWEHKMGLTYRKTGMMLLDLLRFSLKKWQILSYFPSLMVKIFFIFFLVSICKILKVQQHNLKWQNSFCDSLHFLCQNNEKFYTFSFWKYISRCEYHNRFIYSLFPLDLEKLDILAWNTWNPRKRIKVHLSYVTKWWKYNGNNISTLRGEKLVTWMVARDNGKFL